MTGRFGVTEFSAASDLEVVMTRAFAAPRALVFDMWTSPEHLPRWMGPAEWTMTICEIDLRPGGAFRYHWRRADGAEMGISGVYHEVTPPERVVSSESWDGWSGTLNTLVLAQEPDGATTVTLTMRFPSQQARDAALATRMREGSSEGFDRLDALLAAHAR
ncbi:SRPBCC family protein [Streptosporangiaceae bacterium NEAU-GS5]|nr:SRPBCC family protein [Streptosporangiaceae bacterium NEAU-GS5]